MSTQKTLQQKAVSAATMSRDALYTQLEAVKAYLESTGMGYRKSLIDAEGYPLPNIDHYKIMEERQRGARLINDVKKIEHVLELLLETVPTDGQPTLTMELESLHPFALISEVKDKSPAESAGLVEGDFLIKFGKGESMLQVKENIHENEEIELVVFRVEEFGKKQYKLHLTPSKWTGDGLVGCHLIPI